MSQQARVGYATFDGDNRFGDRPRLLPIIIVPGLMGTRLVDPETNRQIWNPMGAPVGDDGGFFAADARRLMDTDSELVPDTEHPFRWREDREAVAEVRDFNVTISAVYKDLAIRMANLDSQKMRDCGVKPRVYVCGYDWRIDIARSSLRLADTVDRALRETGAPRVILLCHSLGTMLARFYCRMLGGEQKVHRHFMLGAMYHGVPETYTQVKNGLAGFYIGDIVDAENGAAQVGEVAMATSNLGKAIKSAINATGAGGAVAGAFKGFVGDIYLAMCLGSFKLFSRADTIALARRMVSLFQLMPTAIYCNMNKNWVMFDPLATGYSPAGFTVRLPFVMEALTDITAEFAELLEGGAAAAGDEVRRDIDAFFGREVQTSERADLNAPNVVELFEHAAEEAGEGHYEAPVRAVRELHERIEAVFLDCRNNERLYYDIYTGLLDIVEHRARSAANLAQAFRMEEALTVRYHQTHAFTPYELIEPVTQPIFDKLGVLLDAAESPVAALLGGTSVEHEFDRRKQERDLATAAEEQAQEHLRRHPPVAYVPPRCINVYCDTEPTVSGAWVHATDFVARHDHNQVTVEMTPDFLANAILLLGALGAAGVSGVASDLGSLGDDRIPLKSTHPDPATLSRAFFAAEKFPNISHGDLASHATVIDYVVEQIDLSIEEFCEL